MIKTTKLQTAIMLSSIIGSIMANYNPSVANERLKPITIIKARLKKFMYKRSRTNEKEFVEAIGYANIVWRNSINHFAESGLKIDAVSIVIRLYNLYSNELSRFANINDKQIESFAYNQSSEVTEYIELTSYEVSDYILDQLAEYTGVVKVNKLGLIMGSIEKV